MSWLNTILIFLVAYVAVFLESAFDGARHWLGAQIDLLPALIVYASLSSSLLTLATVAMVGGLWFDTLSANPLGISVLPLFVPGYLIYLRRELILRDQLLAQTVLGLFASALTPVLTLMSLSIARHSPVVGWRTLWEWLVMSAGGAVATPVFFKLFDGLDHALSYRPVIENSFRPDREIRRGRN